MTRLARNRHTRVQGLEEGDAVGVSHLHLLAPALLETDISGSFWEAVSKEGF